MADMAPFSADELYFGSVPIALAKAPGNSMRYVHSQWKISFDDADLATTIARAAKYLPPDQRDSPPFIIPGIPAREIVPTADLEPLAEPSLLSSPLLKVPIGHPDSLPVKAVASGVRSGLVKNADGKWYRLKGCGNNDEGFIVRTTPAGSETSAWRDVRGSAFLHTALRECFMAQETSDLLEPIRLPCCNIPVCIFQYGPPHDLLGPERPLACIVERTRGDRRLGTHVLAGLQLLLSALVHPESLAKIAAAKGQKGWFPAARPRHGEAEGGGAITTAELLTDMMLAKEMGADGHGLSWPDVPRDETTLAFLGCTALPEIQPPLGDAALPLPVQWSAEGSKEMDARWHDLWRRAAEVYRQEAARAASAGRSVLGYLYSRIGVDCGRILRALHDKRISWGTYQDDMCRRDFGEFHCNAHANNLVLLEGGASGSEVGAMVGLLDLDMAFHEESFVDIWGSKGRISPKAFDALLSKEHLNFMEVLAGGDASSGVPMVGQAVLREMPPHCQELQAALLDTLVLGYLRGYTGEARFPAVELEANLHKGAYAAMEMAVIVMADYIA